MSEDLKGKVALITGANKGIGYEIARQLGSRGATVLVGARDIKRGEEAANQLRLNEIDARSVQLDVIAQKTIDSTAQQIESEFGKLDILVNNAGILAEGDRLPPSQVEIETLRQTYETNVFGVFAVTKALLPLLKKSTAGRIVNLSSGLGSLTQNSDPNYEFANFKFLAYNSSKTVVNAITVLLAAELKDTSIKVNAADPGFTATDINQYQGYRTVEQGAIAAVKLATLPDDGSSGGFFDENGVVPW
ncbi:short-chain dehydrogenase [Nostoc sp. 'Peltigera membranacea cyanobiont' 213]|uniref:SDR family oxidoreductase n=1 Tax=unclassified Nostoc TaxID=2593658 RepID=UPI000B9591CC|nr:MULTISPECIES: SDR family oxidoreductase [unclassified Nostoc]AVH67214.1 short-chain dehydrogenase/reductase SDR [Nostoc sp. 'Peltigera membranacea cyanobiont' N6]OYD94256.1 short-chain dehydrogenase [Nostoc sp. 'Peltigera membranacea cyanobiont' 213]